MAKRANTTPRFETQMAGSRTNFGVYDNAKKCFVQRDLTKAEADALVQKLRDAEIDQFLSRMFRRTR